MKYKVPDYMYQGISLASSNTVVQKTLVKGDSVLVYAMGQPQTVDKATRERIKEQSMPFPELNYLKAGYQISLSPNIENMDEKEAYVINVTSPSGIVTKEYFDVATGLKLRKQSTSGDAPGSVSYANYKDVNGIMFPSKETISEQVEIPLTITDVKINSGLTTDDFK